MPASDPGLRRVSVHCGSAVVDLALPSGLPVAALMPSIVDILNHGDDGVDAKRYRLSLPGAASLNPSKTLAQHGIGDGAVLILSESSMPPPAPRHDDAAEVVSATLDATARPWGGQAARLTGATAASVLTGAGALALVRNRLWYGPSQELDLTAAAAAVAGSVALLFAVIAYRACREPVAGLALSLIAVALAAVAGLLAVPGAPGPPNVLLAAAAAAVTSVLAGRASRCGAVTLTAVSCIALVIAAAASAGVLTAAPLQAVGAASALASLGLLAAAPRASIALAGLSPRLHLDDAQPTVSSLAARATRADRWLTGLTAAFASSAAIGAIATVLAGAPRLSCVAFGGLTAVLLLLRSRSHDPRKTLVFVIAGTLSIATTFVAVAVRMPQHGPWIAASTAALAATAIYLGFAAPAVPLSPVVRRGVESLEHAALVAMVPLTCWVCGLYGAARGLTVQ